MQYVVRSPEALVEKLDSFIDNNRFKSRNQLINVILADWLTKQIHKVDAYQEAFIGREETEEWFKSDREATRCELLGDEWTKYKAQKADVLDGHWETERSFERMEQWTREHERRKKEREELKAEIKQEILEELRSGKTKPTGKSKKKTDAKKKPRSR